MTDLLTTREVQDLLQIDRTTIYRMVEGGQLPAIRVGKQWRFHRGDMDRWLKSQAAPSLSPAPPVFNASAASLSELLPLATVQMIQDTFADALGVMVVTTDMKGEPITQVSNPCGLYRAVMRDEEAVAHCVQDWQQMAGAIPIEPKFSPNDLGLLCARGLIRVGNALKGMVFLGGIAPDSWPPSAAQIQELAQRFSLEESYVAANIHAAFHLDKIARDRVLSFVQRIADILSCMVEDRNAPCDEAQSGAV